MRPNAGFLRSFCRGYDGWRAEPRSTTALSPELEQAVAPITTARIDRRAAIRLQRRRIQEVLGLTVRRLAEDYLNEHTLR